MPSNRLPANTPEHLTTFQVARLLGMAVRSIQLMVNREELEGWKTAGGHRRITRESLERWLQRHPEHHKGLVAAPLQAPAASGRPGDEVAALPAKPAAEQGAEAVPAGPPRGPVVLFIEDSIHYQNLVRLLVDEFFPGVSLRMANDGISGMALYGEVKPDVLMVDLMLPGIDGATLIGALRTQPAFQSTQLIVVTSLSPAEIQKYRFVLQGVTVIHKVDLVERLPAELGRALQNEPMPAGAV